MGVPQIAVKLCWLIAYACAAAGVATAAEPGEAVRQDWRAQYEAMLGEDGRLLPTEEPLAALAAHQQAVQPLEGDRGPADVVLRRTRALLDDLRASGAEGLDPLEATWRALAAEVKAAAADDYACYERACALRRRVAFANPLLDSKRLVFIAGRYNINLSNRHGPDGPGQLLILEGPFGAGPKVVDPLAGVTVEDGRYRGRDLRAGCFAAPEVSWDGKTLYFAWAERGSKHRGAVQEAYTPENTYHIFRADLDENGLAKRLRQLTDGPWNDTDPCELPNGRIVFCSGRRGTTIRCNSHGGYPINNTLFSMEPDGRDPIWLSRHETGEWDPSVDNDGMLVYSRWDYLDRIFGESHNLWTCYPDGRDPRAPHGNYPLGAHASRTASWPDGIPHAELGIRAVPGRRGLYVANTGQRYTPMGTLVLIDLSVPDDRRFSQVRIVTPDVRHACGFHEAPPAGATARCWYATPWPLSERHFLVAQACKPWVKSVKDGQAKGSWGQARYGIYYLDVFGNKELIQGNTLECASPFPLRPRPRPPVIPDQTAQSARATGAHSPASVLVMNVYEGDFTWPEGTEIKRLRLVQILPKSTGSCSIKIGTPLYYESASARFPLGTVPVQEDGSAWFEAPVGREIYFQALDAQGRAVQSMRSGTYVHPGERLSCAGCHEHKHRSRSLPQKTPLALLRAPGGRPWPIEPDVTDAEGRFEVLTFARHIQPILDRRCAGCHRKSEDKRAPALDDRSASADRRYEKYGWTASYVNLGNRMFNYRGKDQDYSRTTPGVFGARAAPLTKHFTPAHHDVRLAPEEWRTVVAWLDCLSPFYGWDWDREQQQRGEKLVPRIDFDPANPLALDRPVAEDNALLAQWWQAIREEQESRPKGD